MTLRSSDSLILNTIQLNNRGFFEDYNRKTPYFAPQGIPNGSKYASKGAFYVYPLNVFVATEASTAFTPEHSAILCQEKSRGVNYNSALLSLYDKEALKC